MEEVIKTILDMGSEQMVEVRSETKRQMAKEITSMVFEFIEWKDEKTEKIDNKYFVYKEILKWRTIYEDVEFTTLNDLFQYWWDNVKNK